MAKDKTEGAPELPPDARLDSLEQRLESAQRIEAERTGVEQADPNVRIGQQVVGQLIGAPLGGALVGIGLDYVLGTRPWFLLAMLFLGFGVGIRNIIRISKTPSATRPGSQA